jgi:hypothetical protein
LALAVKAHKLTKMTKPNLTYSFSLQVGVMPLPFPGMDKSGSAVCELYVRSNCNMGTVCPFRHVRGDKVNYMFKAYDNLT